MKFATRITRVAVAATLALGLGVAGATTAAADTDVTLTKGSKSASLDIVAPDSKVAKDGTVTLMFKGTLSSNFEVNEKASQVYINVEKRGVFRTVKIPGRYSGKTGAHFGTVVKLPKSLVKSLGGKGTWNIRSVTTVIAPANGSAYLTKQFADPGKTVETVVIK